MHLFSTSLETTTLDKVWGTMPTLEPNKKGKKRWDRSSSLEDTPEAEDKQLRKEARPSKRESRENEE